MVDADDEARRVEGSGGLDGLRRLTQTIAAMEARRVAIICELRRRPSASWEEIGLACGMTRQGAARRWSRHVNASSFGAAAEQYQRGRPAYPQSSIDWLVPRRAKRVLDLGAGTGKLSRALVDAGLRVVAVEPSQRMREQLSTAVPDALLCAGSAEQIPLKNGCMDAVAVAHAWHWFDHDRAVREIARVLVPGGTLSLVWNVRDETEPWVAQLGRIMHRHSIQTIDTWPTVGDPFGPPERLEISWSQPMTRAQILDMVASRSYVITLADGERTQLLEDVSEFLDVNPQIRHRDVIAMPYITRCSRARRN